MIENCRTMQLSMISTQSTNCKPIERESLSKQIAVGFVCLWVMSRQNTLRIQVIATFRKLISYTNALNATNKFIQQCHNFVFALDWQSSTSNIMKLKTNLKTLKNQENDHYIIIIWVIKSACNGLFYMVQQLRFITHSFLNWNIFNRKFSAL